MKGCLIVLLITCAALLVFTALNPRSKGKPIPTAYERIEQLNNYINTFHATEDNMYLGIGNGPNYKRITIKEYPELGDIVSNFNRSVKVKEECRVENFSFTPFEARFVWKDIEIYIDLNPDNPRDQIYVYYKAVLYKAEASTDSINQITELAAELK